MKNDTRYRVIAVNLHPDQIAETDRVADTLREEGWPRATRSFVVREALERLSEELRLKTPGELFRFFVERRMRVAAGLGDNNVAKPGKCR